MNICNDSGVMLLNHFSVLQTLGGTAKFYLSWYVRHSALFTINKGT